MKKNYKSNLDVIGISETWLTPYISSEAVKVNGYSFVRCDRIGRRGGGVGIYISEKFNYVILKSLSFYESSNNCFELILVEILSYDSKIIVGVLYVSPSSHISSIENYLSEISVQYDDIILMGDLNCNLLDTNTKEDLLSICHRNNFTVVHNNMPTHFDSFHHSSSLLDVFLVSYESKVCGYRVVSMSASISKHSMIERFYIFDPLEKIYPLK